MKRDELEECIASLVLEKERWIDVCKFGCSDLAYADGVNMNLVRNHMIYYKCKIQEICKKMKVELPEEYYIPVPPVVDNGYMANMKQKSGCRGLLHLAMNLLERSLHMMKTSSAYFEY